MPSQTSSTKKNAITILDGGMGQELLRRSKLEPTPMWSAHVMREMPEVVRDLHVDFIRAGAKVITINAYSVTPERLERDADVADFEQLQQLAISLAREARDIAAIEGVRIAGCLPPLVASYRPDVSPDERIMRTNYSRIVEQQADAVDLFICETMSAIEDARVSAECAKKSGKPVWVALSVEDNDKARLRSGEKLTDAVAVLDRIDVDAKLLNCSQPEAISAAWSALASGIDRKLGAYANGFTSISALKPGGTVDELKSRVDLDPANYAQFALTWVEQNAAIVGGCCEVGPEHIAAVRELLLKHEYSLL